jgi:hypothetical protein
VEVAKDLGAQSASKQSRGTVATSIGEAIFEKASEAVENIYPDITVQARPLGLGGNARRLRDPFVSYIFRPGYQSRPAVAARGVNLTTPYARSPNPMEIVVRQQTRARLRALQRQRPIAPISQELVFSRAGMDRQINQILSIPIAPSATSSVPPPIGWRVASFAAEVTPGVSILKAVFELHSGYNWFTYEGVSPRDAQDAAVLSFVDLGAASVALRWARGFAGEAPRVFSSTDRYVAELANDIEAAYPGHVVGVNMDYLDDAGRQITEVDILLRNAAIQVKSGGGTGATRQVMATIGVTELPTIAYGPDLGIHVMRSINGLPSGMATRDRNLLIELVRP